MSDAGTVVSLGVYQISVREVCQKSRFLQGGVWQHEMGGWKASYGSAFCEEDEGECRLALFASITTPCGVALKAPVDHLTSSVHEEKRYFLVLGHAVRFGSVRTLCESSKALLWMALAECSRLSKRRTE